MGCSIRKLACPGPPKEVPKELSDFVTPKETAIARHTWEIVQKDMTGTGILLFTRLFEQQEGLKKMFKRMMTQSESGYYKIDWSQLSHHADLVMTTMEDAINHLDDSRDLSLQLMSLGERHFPRNVQPDMLLLMWPAFRDTLRDALLLDFTVDAELAWKHIFDYVISKMQQGILKGRAEKAAAPLDSPSTG